MGNASDGFGYSSFQSCFLKKNEPSNPYSDGAKVMIRQSARQFHVERGWPISDLVLNNRRHELTTTMAAWGTGSFENDEAGDWATELEDASDFSLVIEAFDAALEGEDFLDADTGCVAIAAAEVVATSLGNPGDYEGDAAESIEDFVERVGQPAPDALRKTALKVLDLVMGDESELSDIWEVGAGWRASIRDLQARLQN